MIRRSLLVALVALSLSTGVVARAQEGNNAEKVAAAKALFDQGQTLMDQKKFGDACAKFRASNDQVQKVGTLLNLADCYEKNGQNASAWATYNDAIGLGRRQGRPEFEVFAKKKTADLEPTLLLMTLVVPHDVMVDGLVVTRDRVKLDDGAWGVPIPVDPGTHVIEATAPKKLPWKGTIEITPDKKTAEIKVGPLADAPVDAPIIEREVVTRVVERQGTWTPLRLAGVVTASAGAVALVGGGVFGGVAMSTWKTAKDGCGINYPVCDFNSDSPGKADQAKTFATLSTVLFIGGAAAVSAGVLMFVLGGPKKQEAARVFPLVGPGSVGLGGAF